MNDNKKSIWNKRLPSILGILFLSVSIGTIGWLSANSILFGTKAATDATPKNVKISNISDRSFSVSFVTDDSVESSIKYGKSNDPNLVALDDRDQQKGSISPHTTHHITINKLEPSVKYFFVITSGDKNFLNNSVPYEVTLPANPLVKGDTQNIMTGKITNDDGTTPNEGIVYATIDQSKFASGLVIDGGIYSLDLNSLGEISQDTILNLLIVGSNKESKVSLSGNQISPVPLVILSKNYDFLFGNEPLQDLEEASESAETTPAAFPTSSISTDDTGPQILTPEKDEGLSDQQPTFTGTAQPNAQVVITIESDPITTTIKAGKSGNWQFRPDTKLEPGTHTITIKTTDAQGILRTIKQSFVVYAEGSQFTEPSVSPVPSTSSGPTATATTVPTAAPTAVSTPTPTAVQSNSVTTTASPTITAQAPIPVTGNITLMIIIISIVSSVVIGTLLFIFTAV